MKKNIFVLFFAIILPFLHIEAADIQENILKQEWNAFTKQYSNLTSFSAVEIAEIANQWGQKVAEELDVHDGVREIDPQIVNQLLVLLVQKEPKIFMRHGEQQKTERIQQLPPALQKVEMMRLPDNMENSLTNVSIAELMEGMIVMEYLKQKTHQLFYIGNEDNQEFPYS